MVRVVYRRRIERAGFTIVELLIVIVVIAILAAISVVAYNGMQGRAEDVRRITDAKNIVKALELYKINNGNYPAVEYSGKGGIQGWEVSSNESAGQFIAPLATAEYGFPNGVAVDPVNNATAPADGTANNLRDSGGYTYLYYRYNPGTNGCDASRGNYYVLIILRTKTSGLTKHPDSPGLQCGAWSWENYGSWLRQRLAFKLSLSFPCYNKKI